MPPHCAALQGAAGDPVHPAAQHAGCGHRDSHQVVEVNSLYHSHVMLDIKDADVIQVRTSFDASRGQGCDHSTH